jgi:hypothetical protein
MLDEHICSDSTPLEASKHLFLSTPEKSCNPAIEKTVKKKKVTMKEVFSSTSVENKAERIFLKGLIVLTALRGLNTLRARRALRLIPEFFEKKKGK